MDFKENKHEIMIGILICIFFASLYMFFKGPNKNASKPLLTTNYEMPRPKTLPQSSFSLDGREIDYEYENPFAKKDGSKSDKDKKGVIKDAKKKKDDKKKVADKKNQKKATPGRVVHVKLNRDQQQGEQKAAEPMGAGGSGYHGNQGQNPLANQPQQDPEDQDRTAQQWRSLLNAQPTQENMDRLLRAYNRKQISDAEFYSIIDDLMKNNRSDTQRVALYGLRAIHSAKSFSIISENYDSLSSDVKPQAMQMLMSYADSARADVLGQAMRSGRPKTVYMAVKVVQMSLQNSGTDARDVRAGGNQRVLRKFSTLMPTLQQLQQSGQSEIAALSQQVYAQLSQMGAGQQSFGIQANANQNTL